MATPQELARAQRLLADRQNQLEQLERVKAQLTAEIEKNTKLLEQLQKEAETTLNANLSTTPYLSTSAPANFQSQYSQFNTTSAQRLQGPKSAPKPLRNINVSPRPGEAPNTTRFDRWFKSKAPTAMAPPITRAEDTGTLPVNKPPEQQFNMADNRVDWTEINTRSSDKVYVSGQYVRTLNGSPIQEAKEYEYELTAGALPMAVGEEIIAPVHPGGHYRGMLAKTQYLVYRVNSIYEGRKYFGEHDRIEEKRSG